MLSASVNAQSSSELRTLFFDPVYPDDPDKILLTSGAREGFNPGDNQLQPEVTERPPSEILAEIQRYEDSINRQIEESGIYETGLAQQYLTTGNLYEQLGDQEQAVTAYENAMHINRVNEGLFTLSQANAVRALIESNQRTRNFAEADKYQEYLYYIQSQNLAPGDDELVAATLEWADWNMEAFRRMAFMDEEGLSFSTSAGISSAGASMLRRGELIAIEDNQFSEILFVPRTALLVNPANARMQAFTAEQLVDPRLKQAEDLYDKLLETNEDNLDVLRRKADITYLYKKQLEQYIGVDTFGSTFGLNKNQVIRSVSVLRRGYSDNREDLLELAMSLEASEPLKAATVYLDIADWDLLFSRQGRARETYGKARELLLDLGMTEDQITDFITPEAALLIPGFVSHEYTRRFQNIPETKDIPYIGYIDVSFDKRANGTLRRVDIENVSENTGRQIRDRLLEMLGSATMRPLFVAGETVSQSDIKVRYYYSY